MSNRNPQKSFLIYLFFFLSGAAGLAYEVLWVRILGLSFGHTVYAVTTVLAAFMAGLALGSYFFGRLADRYYRPLRLYAYLELGIGFYCLAAPGLLALARKAYLAFYPLLMDSPSSRTLIQFLLAFFVLVIPTTLMGGTLPAVIRAIVPKRDAAGRKVALLYGTNTLGAATGAFATGYLLLPSIGIRATNYMGAGINLLVGLAVLILFGGAVGVSAIKELSEDHPGSPERVSDSEDGVRANEWKNQTTNLLGEDPVLEKVLLLGFALSGAVAMAYQIAWVRALVLVIGSSTYAFSAILVTFLMGIALGSYIFPKIKNGETPRFFAGLQIGIGLSAFLLIPFFNFLPLIFLSFFKGYKGSYINIQFIQFLIVATIVLLPTTFLGMTFPCLTGILTKNFRNLGRDVGTFYAFNTFGAIAGIVLTGFFLIPFLGAQRTLSLGICMNMLIAAVILITLSPARARIMIPGIVGMAIFLFLLPGWDKKVMTSGVSIYPRTYYQPDVDGRIGPRHKNWDVLFFKEGLSATVAVTKQYNGRVLRINGKAEAGIRSQENETNIKLAYLPLMIHPEPRDVAVIGLGGGYTAYTAGLIDSVKSIDVIELEPAVIEAFPIFAGDEMDLLSNEAIHIYPEDGRSYIVGAGKNYDVIINAPSNPWISGVSSLFTEEFFREVKSKLNSGGIFSQWVQGYGIQEEELKAVFNTFLKVFPYATLWEGDSTDYILIGPTDEPGEVRVDDIFNRIEANSSLAQFFKNYGDLPFESFITSYRLNSSEIRSYSGEAALNTDDQNQLEFKAPKSLYRGFPTKVKSDILSLKSTSNPHFIHDTRFEEVNSHLYLGQYLLKHDHLDIASWEFRQTPSLAPEYKGIGDGGPEVSLPKPASIIKLDFEVPTSVPFFPQLEGVKPEENKIELAYYNAYMEYFNRITGAIKGQGREGGTGLVLRGIGDGSAVALAARFAVNPSTSYNLDFWLKDEAGTNTYSGVGILEYDKTLPTDEEMTQKFSDEHLIDGTLLFQSSGQPEWTRHIINYRTSPRTLMVHLVFNRMGGDEIAPIVFDDIVIQENQ
jgi:spermidine synthase